MRGRINKAKEEKKEKYRTESMSYASTHVFPIYFSISVVLIKTFDTTLFFKSLSLSLSVIYLSEILVHLSFIIREKKQEVCDDLALD